MKEEQQLLLDQFYGQQKIWYPDYFYLGYAAGIILFITMLMIIPPCQIWEGDYQVFLIGFFLELMGLEMYVRRYCECRDGGKMKSIYETLRCLPVSRKQLIMYALKKLWKLCLRLTGVAVCCQVVFSLIFLHSLSVGNLLAPILFCLVLPMLLFGGIFLVRK